MVSFGAVRGGCDNSPTVGREGSLGGPTWSTQPLRLHLVRSLSARPDETGMIWCRPTNDHTSEVRPGEDERTFLGSRRHVKLPVEAGDEGCLSIESRATEEFRCNLGGLPRRSFRPEAVPIDRETRAKLPSWTAQKLVDEPFDDQRRARRSARARGKIGSPTYGRPAVPRRARDRGRRERPRRLGAEAVATRRSARFNEETGKTARIGTRVTPGRETA